MPVLDGAYVPLRFGVLGALQDQDAPAYEICACRCLGGAPA